MSTYLFGVGTLTPRQRFIFVEAMNQCRPERQQPHPKLETLKQSRVEGTCASKPSHPVNCALEQARRLTQSGNDYGTCEACEVWRCSRLFYLLSYLSSKACYEFFVLTVLCGGLGLRVSRGTVLLLDRLLFRLIPHPQMSRDHTLITYCNPNLNRSWFFFSKENLKRSGDVKTLI